MGYIEVVCGCMYSGKTEELLRQMRRCDFARKSYKSFKPLVDQRYSKDEIVSHNKDSISSIVIEKSVDIFKYLEPTDQVVGVDEAQFFDSTLIEVATQLANRGVRVVLAGLDTDWKGQPFGPMADLLAVADVVHKQYAICVQCGEAATRTQRLVANTSDVLVGSFNMYEARCRQCFDPMLSLQKDTQKKESMNTESLSC